MLENLHIGVVVGIEALVETGFVDVEAVGVLHIELAHSEQTTFGAWLVAELQLDLIPLLGQVLVGTDLDAVGCEDFFVGHTQRKIGSLAVLQAEHFIAHDVPPTGLLPDPSGMHSWQVKFLRTHGIHV